MDKALVTTTANLPILISRPEFRRHTGKASGTQKEVHDREGLQVEIENLTCRPTVRAATVPRFVRVVD